MKVSVKKEALTELIREAMTVPKAPKDSPVSVTEPPYVEAPVDASEEVEQEGIFELPPVEDDEYAPNNLATLSRAAFALAKMVPPKQLDRFYRRLHDLTQDAIAWQKEEDMNMGVVEERLRRKIRQLIAEATGGRPDISGLMDDFEEDEPVPQPGEPGHDAWQRSVRRAGDVISKSAEEKRPKSWDDIKLKPKKRDVEFFDQPGYRAEPAEPPGGYGNPMTLDSIAGEVEGLNTPSAVKQFLQDPRKLNVLDKLGWLAMMPEDDRQKIATQAAADFITKLEAGKEKEGISHNDKVIRNVVNHYISDLEEEGAVDDEDAKTLRSRTEFVVGLDSFRRYLVDFFDHNFDDLAEYDPFRRHLDKFIRKAMRDDPELMAFIEKRKNADIERVQKKKAEKAAERAAKKAGK